MNNFFHYMHNLIDTKLAIFAFFFGVITLSHFELAVKIIGGLAFIGYTIRRWYIMEHNNKNNKNDENFS